MVTSEKNKNTSLSVRKEIKDDFKIYCKNNRFNGTGIISDLIESYLVSEKFYEKKAVRFKISKTKNIS